MTTIVADQTDRLEESKVSRMKAPVAVVILTYNEEANLPYALASVTDWARQVFVVDSFSTDRTLEIAKSHGAEVFQHPFEHWATQRNWAIDTLPTKSPWTLFLDADESVTEDLAEEISRELPRTPDDVAGYYLDRRFFFLGRCLKHGGYRPNWVLRLVRANRTRVVPAGDREYFHVNGKTLSLSGNLLHEDRRGLDFWIAKHNRISNMAVTHMRTRGAQSGNGTGSSKEGHLRNWLRANALERFPALLRPFGMFIYRYFLRLGFFDGKEGAIYYFLHDFWYPFLIAAKTFEAGRDERH